MRSILTLILMLTSLPASTWPLSIKASLQCESPRALIVLHQEFSVERGYAILGGFAEIHGLASSEISAADIQVIVKPPYTGPAPVSEITLKVVDHLLTLRVYQSVHMMLALDQKHNSIRLNDLDPDVANCAPAGKR